MAAAAEHPRSTVTGRHVGLAGLALSTLYLVLHQRTWSLDGAIHTLASGHSMDDSASGHVLLPMVAWAWTSLAGAFAPLTFAARYDLLEFLFGAFGVTALTLMFRLALVRSGAVAAWLALAAIAISRDVERHLTNFDEKPLGMLLFAIALTWTASSYGRFGTAPAEPRVRDVLPMALAWLVAVFGHLQNAPFAAAVMAGIATFMRAPGRFTRWLRLMLRLAPLVLAASLVLLSLLYAQEGGPAALPRLARLARHLLVERVKPAAAPGPTALVQASLVGQVKAFFLLDRLSPLVAVGAAMLGYAVLLASLAAGVRRRGDPLAWTLAGGTVLLGLVIPAANAFPQYGDSYTIAVTAAPVLLAAAPRFALVACVALLWFVNLPAAIAYSRPETTQRLHLARMIEMQERHDAPWVLLDELTPFDREQGLAPVYYAMSERLRHERHTLDRLPSGRFLLELPQVIGPDGTSPTGRVAELQRELEARGRASGAERLWDPLRQVRSDFRRYGDLLVVEPAPGEIGEPPPEGASTRH